jgi:hypothetical protein
MENIATSLGRHHKLVADSIHVVKGGQSQVTVGEKIFSVATPRRNCSSHPFKMEDFKQVQL